MNDSYIYIIVALLPLVSVMLTVQSNPYNALVIRGILGAIAALIYTLLGAADVALTEALVGTMLAVTLYVVAVRSSLVMRLGVLNDHCLEFKQKSKGDADSTQANQRLFAQLISDLQSTAKKYHLQLELIPYPDCQSLHQALMEKEIHATCMQRSHSTEQDFKASGDNQHPYQTTTRIRRLYDILQTDLASSVTSLAYVTDSNITPSTPITLSNSRETH